MPASLAPLSVLAVALPFLFCVTDAPTASFWPLVASWLCGAVLLCAAALEGLTQRPAGREAWARRLAWGLALAAVVGGVIGLAQYVAGDLGLSPFVHPSVPGQAVGNLRQRNQQASLLSLGAWALLWWTMHGRPWPRWGVGAALAVIAIASAATASRTGAVQWLLVLGFVLCWRRTGAGQPLRWAVAALLVFVAAAWVLPELLWRIDGVRADALFHRFAGDPRSCTSRRVLWANMLTLIAQKPWLGWGWGELDYAHYVTLFPGERFCVLLDNAHNLPLHLAVELGVPAAVLACGALLAWALASRPWREAEPARQLAWGVLAIIGLHSLLEYPLWYGPFQVVALLSAALLLWPRRRSGTALAGLGAALIALACALAAWDYFRVSQLYKASTERAPAYRDDTQAKVAHSVLFASQIGFARLTTTALTRDNAERMNALAHDLLHYSPEPRVIEPLIESAALLGRDDEAAFHMQRYRAAYPQDYARWMGAGIRPASKTL
ncbi:MAG: Wzy polymerase domain-containing protein [Acidovorax sp.]|uniref:PglL family O-oligosaccharyltransferase n=1 Tax=Acidovorax sp. TaxID=1872122 RepID=UPI0039E2CC98